ncbi:cobalt-precorrin 5A hydrolase [Lachnospiraceae bacterium XBB1006]|nr:cobalt-precorrin 5A hydrolase [Lachnospiraceae bacterium XBB1006]
MIINVCYFSEEGKKRAEELFFKESVHIIRLREKEALPTFLEHAFAMHEGIFFIGASGIAVRMIAPFVKDKRTDSPVVVMDDAAHYCISLLAGHLGGANELARYLADFYKAMPVITTATDVHGAFAVDLFAKKNHLAIAPKEGIQIVSSKTLRKEVLTVAVDPEVEMEGRLPEGLCLVAKGEEADIAISMAKRYVENAIVTLYVKPLVLGMGCKKGTSFTALKEATDALFWEEIAAIVSVEQKQQEIGLQELASYHQVAFETYKAKVLCEVDGVRNPSEFVKKTVGVSNVCESSALFAAGREAKLEIEKVAGNGITYAVARKRKPTLRW